MQDNKLFKIKNKFLSGLVIWLQMQLLSGKDSRERTRFVSLCQDRLKEYNGFYQGLMDKYIQKGKDGKYETVKVGDLETYKFITKKDEEEHLKEVNDLFEEEFKIEITQLSGEMLRIIKNIVLNTEYRFGPKEGTSIDEKNTAIRLANEYSEWCQSFESI